jgi:hypothetical protein
VAIHASVRPLPSPRARGGCRAVPFPHRRPRRVPSLPVQLTYVLVTCAAHSLTARLSPIVVGHAAGPAMTAGAYVPWCLRSSLAKPMAPMSVAGASGARVPPLAAGSHLDNRNRLARPSPPLCCKYTFQMFLTYVAIVTDGY